MIYNLLYLSRGRLPWQTNEDMDKLELFEFTKKKKQKTNMSDLFSGKGGKYLP